METLSPTLSNGNAQKDNKQKEISKDKKDLIPARLVLYLLSFTGFLVSFMMRNDINLAMVAMAKIPLPDDFNSTQSEQLYCYKERIEETPSANDSNSLTFKETNEEGEFDWDTTIQTAIISSFYWSYVVAQVVGGILTQKFGSKIVFGYSQLATAIPSLLIPACAEIHWSLLVILRSIQGAASGLTWPAMYAMVGVWIPVAERSRFMSSFQGFSIGIGLTYPICGFIIAHFGWRIVFYFTGSLGILWCIFWYFLGFDEPEQHPRISKRELTFIKKNIDNSVVSGKGVQVPWLEIFKSKAAWAIGITTFGRIYVHYTFIIPGPLYMKTVLGFSIQKNGILSGAPFICSYVSSVIFCYLADIFVTKKIFSLTTVRKIFTATSQVIPGILVILIGFVDCNIILVLVLWFIAVTLITAAYAGAMANIVDIAPNFAGPVLAFAQTIHMSASFVSPLVAGFLLKDNVSNLDQWRKVFGVTSVVAVGTYFVYQLYGTSQVQSWNRPHKKNAKNQNIIEQNQLLDQKNGESV